MYEHTFAICAYGESPYLEECILSLKGQTVKSNIIIVTSTPNEFINQLAKKYDVLVYENKEETGITQDWNYAYSCAKTKYVTLSHQDDIYEKDYLKEMLAAVHKAHKPLIFFCDYYEIRNGERVEHNRLLAIKELMLFPLRGGFAQRSRWVRRRILSLGSPICCPSVTYVKEHLPEVIFQNHFRSCEDWEAWEMISRRKGQFVYCHKKLVGHRIHHDSVTTEIIVDNKRSEEEYELYCKFWPKWIAGFLVKLYANSQKSNQLKEQEGIK